MFLPPQVTLISCIHENHPKVHFITMICLHEHDPNEPFMTVIGNMYINTYTLRNHKFSVHVHEQNVHFITTICIHAHGSDIAFITIISIHPCPPIVPICFFGSSPKLVVTER